MSENLIKYYMPCALYNFLQRDSFITDNHRDVTINMANGRKVE